MRFLKSLCFIVLTSALVLGQSSTSATSPDNSSVSDELKKLREALAEQQKQLAQQQQEIEKLRQQVATTPATTTTTTATPVAAKSGEVAPRTIDAALHTPTRQQGGEQPEASKPSPLSFRIGGAEFTPGGFVDFENVFRSTNTTNVIGTNFGQIPFSNTVQGHLTEFRSSAQFSRISLKVTDKFKGMDLTGYVEADFNGNDAANVFVTANSHTNRMRLYWLDVKKGKWQFDAGQMWSWLTPNRVGLGPATSDLFVTQLEDANITVGQVYTRANQFRVAYHFNDNVAAGVGIENPQQYVGIGEVVFPFLFNAQLGPQFDAANNAGTPNLHPDIVPKITFDGNPGNNHVHLEFVGLITSKKDAVIGLTPNFVTNTATGGGMSANASVVFAKKFGLFANTFWSDGGGRYLFGLAPDLVVRPDGTISLVHSMGGTTSFEWQLSPNTLIAGVYGVVYAQRNFFLDPTNPVPGRFAGFGAPNSPNTANRILHEPSVSWLQTLWGSPQYGKLQLVTQASYISRAPWFVAPGAPKNAHLGMGYVSLKYILP